MVLDTAAKMQMPIDPGQDGHLIGASKDNSFSSLVASHRHAAQMHKLRPVGTLHTRHITSCEAPNNIMSCSSFYSLLRHIHLQQNASCQCRLLPLLARLQR